MEPIDSINNQENRERLARYRDEDESDTFILSGAEDIVPCLVKNNGAWSRKPEDSKDGTHRIYFYRPRIEGLFARIEKWVNKNMGDTYWPVDRQR